MGQQSNLNELVERLKKSFGDRLVSVILYGSAAAADNADLFSDLNVFCVLRAVTPRELEDSEPVFRWWMNQKNPPPLLMSEEEVQHSTDCFPIEYRDMQERRRVLFGKDVIDGLAIDESFYRAQVEFEFRSKLLRLRQKAASVLHDRELLAKLMTESVSTFLILARHALLLSGVAAGTDRRRVAALCAEHFQADAAPLLALLDVREGKTKARSLEAGPLFAQYLATVEALTAAVDRLQK